MRVDPRFLKEEGAEVFTGNELLIKGALEAEGGTHLLTGYPGSPIAGFFDAMELVAPLFKEKGIRASISNNEALGAAMLNGSQMGPLRAICAMKSVGLHVAADALALGQSRGRASRRRRAGAHRRRPVERLDAGAGRFALPLQTPLHAGDGAEQQPGTQGLG